MAVLSPKGADDSSLALLDHMPVGVFIIRNDFSLLYWNRTLENWTGIAWEEMVGSSILKRYPHLGEVKYRPRIEAVFEGAPLTILSSLLHKYIIPIPLDDGGFRIQQTTITAIEAEGGGRHALFTIQDITELNNRIGELRTLRDKAFHEVEQRQKAEAKLRLSASVFDSTQEGIMVVAAADGTIESVNNAFSQITGYSREETIGETPQMFWSDKQSATVHANLWKELSERGEWSGELWVCRKNEETFPLDLSISAIQDDEGVVTHYAAIFTDITERKKAEDLLRTLSSSDPLTQLANRRSLDDSLAAEWRRAQRSNSTISLVMIDIDYFKRYNDSYGHQQGDDCLIQVADLLRTSLHRPGDFAARYGGEEFILTLPNLTADEAARLMTTIQKKLAHLAIEHNDSPVCGQVTLSAGVAATVPSSEDKPERLIAQADRALYRAKQEGRNRVVVAEGSA